MPRRIVRTVIAAHVTASVHGVGVDVSRWTTRCFARESDVLGAPAHRPPSAIDGCVVRRDRSLSDRRVALGSWRVALPAQLPVAPRGGSHAVRITMQRRGRDVRMQ